MRWLHQPFYALPAISCMINCFQAVCKSQKERERDSMQDHNTTSVEFHKSYNFCAVSDKDKLIRLQGQKVKGQCHSETKCTSPTTVCR